MAKKKKQKCPECPPEGAPGWMATFADLNSLLLTFFVLLISMATFSKPKFAEVMGSIQKAFGVLESDPTVAINNELLTSLPVTVNKIRGRVGKRVREIQLEAESKNEAKNIELVETEKGIAIRIYDDLLFTAGSDVLNVRAYPILDKISDIIKYWENTVRIEGHTDNVPIPPGGVFKSNWELSVFRSIAVMNYFVNKNDISPEKFYVCGFGEFKPIAPNIPKYRSKNRRVEIFIEISQREESPFTDWEEAEEKLLPSSLKILK